MRKNNGNIPTFMQPIGHNKDLKNKNNQIKQFLVRSHDDVRKSQLPKITSPQTQVNFNPISSRFKVSNNNLLSLNGPNMVSKSNSRSPDFKQRKTQRVNFEDLKSANKSPDRYERLDYIRKGSKSNINNTCMLQVINY
jgi:hypothetical protein